ncbi:Anti-sigma-K factor RskA [Actinopolymorpha cephalotaxi]|uniref:Regulator of SigK n=1 Tax=Actinopolymorpha cephalotaxi TaxID=504797 RepID=A0A1I2ZUR7_9ACTN|nr:anti-sigma factor [Actinopolymorpha cephalotaxi]NYH84180.1 anti-sigma-K factor RskA [Actinopolymorpha cephalotaxi]SFH41553.1 Anti-sigma-K factor RskA [Actinopolymorpha cephalotaxi]
MNAFDVHTLAGAYALDAVPADECEAFETHLRKCRACRAELDEFGETAVRLAHAVAVPPPARLRERVLEQVGWTRQLAPVVSRPAFHGGRLGRRVFAAAAALVLIVAAGVTGVQIHRLQRGAAQRELITSIVAAPDARSIHGGVTRGGRITLVYSRRQDRTLVIVDRLPRPPKGRAYQMWLLNDGTARSAGMLDVSGPAQLTRVVKSPLTQADGFGLTVEPRGGSSRPTTPVIALLSLR